MAPQTDDPFDDLLTLEDTLYTTAHDQGVADGARAGRIEGRIFGLEKGFEKFAALGELHGRGAVWGARLPTPPSSHSAATPSQSSSTATPEVPGLCPSTHAPASAPASTQAPTSATLPPLPNPTPRLQSNTSLLYHLTDPSTFSTSNTEVSVADFDDRVKRAGAKAKVIERIVGEASPSARTTADSKSPERKGKNVRLEGDAKRGGKKGGDSMEDFVGSRLIG